MIKSKMKYLLTLIFILLSSFIINSYLNSQSHFLSTTKESTVPWTLNKCDKTTKKQTSEIFSVDYDLTKNKQQYFKLGDQGNIVIQLNIDCLNTKGEISWISISFADDLKLNKVSGEKITENTGGYISSVKNPSRWNDGVFFLSKFYVSEFRGKNESAFAIYVNTKFNSDQIDIRLK